jgi:hypothetical protein
MWGALSDERDITSAAFLISDLHMTHEHILLILIYESPNLEGHVPVFISPPEQGSRVLSPGIG